MKNIANLLKALLAMALAMVISFSAAAAPKPTEVELTRVNTYIFSSEINLVTTDEFMAALVGKRILLDSIDPQATLYVVIVSGGGSYESSLLMKTLIEKVPHVTLICKYCASAAGFIFGTTPVPRLVIKKSILLMHEMYLAHYTAKQAMTPSIAKNLIKSSEEFNKSMYTKLQMSKEDYEKKIVDKEWNLYGEEIVKNHLADKLVTIKCDYYLKQLAPDTCSQEEAK